MKDSDKFGIAIFSTGLLGMVVMMLTIIFLFPSCSKRHRPPVDTQPAMPTLDEARAMVPNPPRTTTQPDGTTGHTMVDLYVLGPSTVAEGTSVQYRLIALYRGAGYVMAQDVTDPANHKPYKLWMGDANLDGKVDIIDLGILSGNYGKQIDLTDPNSHPWRAGDFNFDGVVDVEDLGMLAGNYGKEASDG